MDQRRSFQSQVSLERARDDQPPIVPRPIRQDVTSHWQGRVEILDFRCVPYPGSEMGNQSFRGVVARFRRVVVNIVAIISAFAVFLACLECRGPSSRRH